MILFLSAIQKELEKIRKPTPSEKGDHDEKDIPETNLSPLLGVDLGRYFSIGKSLWHVDDHSGLPVARFYALDQSGYLGHLSSQSVLLLPIFASHFLPWHEYRKGGLMDHKEHLKELLAEMRRAQELARHGSRHARHEAELAARQFGIKLWFAAPYGTKNLVRRIFGTRYRTALLLDEAEAIEKNVIIRYSLELQRAKNAGDQKIAETIKSDLESYQDPLVIPLQGRYKSLGLKSTFSARRKARLLAAAWKPLGIDVKFVMKGESGGSEIRFRIAFLD